MSSGDQDHNCRSCGAPIIWRAHEKTNRLAPIDVRPDPKGNLVLLGEELYGVRLPGVLRGVPRYTSHYVTCPEASEWRVRGRGEPA